MSLNRYHNSRSTDNVFKLLHEETSYLEILKGNVKAVYQDEIEETGAHENARQQLLHEQDDAGIDVDANDAEKASEKGPGDEQGTPEEEEAAAEKAGQEANEIKEMVQDELEEMMGVIGKGAKKSIDIARRQKITGLLATKGRRPGSIKKAIPRAQRRTPVGLGG